MNLTPKDAVEPEIPSTYFSLLEPEINTQDLVKILSSVPNSPLTPGLLPNFAPIFPNPPFQTSNNRVHDYPNLTPENLRYLNLQQQALQQQMNTQNSLASSLRANVMPSFSSGRPSVSPRSTSTNTSGYLSHASNMHNISSSANSLEQLYAPYKPAIQINGNGINHFPQTDSQIFIGSSANNLSRHLNESGSQPFEAENRLLTPSYHSVCTRIIHNALPLLRLIIFFSFLNAIIIATNIGLRAKAY